MDLVLCQGIRTSRLFPKTSKFQYKLPFFIHKYPEVTIYRQIQCTDKQQNYLFQSKYLRLVQNRYTILLEPTSLTCTVNNKIQYGTSSQKSDSSENKDCYAPPPSAKPSLFQRMKQMTKDYWHILVPVHLVTSAGWMSIFYIAAKNGVDIVGILESFNLSERFLGMLRESGAGHWAVAYALYKIFTPIRYTVTLGGTTMSIRYLNKWGYIKVKKSPELEQSLKCAEEHRSAFKNSNVSSKGNQSQTNKT